LLERDRTTELARRVRERTAELERALRQLRGVAELAAQVNACQSTESVLRLITDEARKLIGAQLAMTSATVDGPDGQALQMLAPSDEKRAWTTVLETDGTDVAMIVCHTNRPLRLTAADLATQPADAAATNGSAPSGWLGAPLIRHDGRNMGLIQLVGKQGGIFNESDEAVLMQLAHLAATAVENAELFEELRLADRRKDDFLALLAHELRNPLSPILNSAHFLRTLAATDSHTRSAAEVIDRQVRHLARLVDDLLDVSRITRGKITLQLQPLDLRTAVNGAIEIARPMIDGRQHHLTVELPPERLGVTGDLTRLTQAIGNLLMNAAKYTDPGGRINVRLSRDGTSGLLRIKDSGCGIAPELLPHIFDLFAQGDRTLERSQGGLGIGLTLVKRLVEMHGGTVAALSGGPGHGSEFVVTIPATIRSPSADDHMGTAAGRAGRRATKRVLIADDNRDAADSLAALLRIQGHDVRLAYDGTTALATAQAFRPDIALLDIGMPGLCGYDVAQALRADPNTSSTALVALTGWGGADDRKRSAESGFTCHLVKPIDPSALDELLRCVPVK
jgi:signal transduction histidine kinase